MDQHQIEQFANAFACGREAQDQRRRSRWKFARLYSPPMWILLWCRLKDGFGNIYECSRCSGELSEGTDSSERLHTVVNLLSIPFWKAINCFLKFVVQLKVASLTGEILSLCGCKPGLPLMRTVWRSTRKLTINFSTYVCECVRNLITARVAVVLVGTTSSRWLKSDYFPVLF